LEVISERHQKDFKKEIEIEDGDKVTSSSNLQKLVSKIFKTENSAT